MDRGFDRRMKNRDAIMISTAKRQRHQASDDDPGIYRGGIGYFLFKARVQW